MNMKKREISRAPANPIGHETLQPGASAERPMRSASGLTMMVLVVVLLTVIAILVAVPLQTQEATVHGSVLDFDGERLKLDTADAILSFEIDDETRYPAALDAMDSVVVHYSEQAGVKTADRITADLNSNDELEPDVSATIDYVESSV